ncbi:MAG TPA: hypothetical protein VLK25_09935 [Allosphingosinicella sp.]|nr:hypothetical protein [Allosphingosinicella sp.]
MDGTDTGAPKRRWKLWHFLAIGAVVLAVFVGIVLTLVLSLTRPVVDGADAFMGALKGGQYEQAYARAAPSLQQEVGDANGLALRVGPYVPREWSWSQRKLRNGIGNVSGRATWQSGDSGTAEIELHHVNDEWRVVTFRFN